MSTSPKLFDRWVSTSDSSWPFYVFKKHELQLMELYWSFVPTRGYVYSHLGKEADWTDRPHKHFTSVEGRRMDTFSDMNSWSDHYNDFENWTNLNALMSLVSYLEIYMDSVISLAIESDIGVLFGAKNRIDGVNILKYGNPKKLLVENHVEPCVKGGWSSRLSAYKSLFGNAPSQIENNISDLEAMRAIRNKIGHAFGRDIESSRKRGVRSITPMERLSQKRLIKFRSLARDVASSIDSQLMKSHIGDFELVLFYHRIFVEMPYKHTQNHRVNLLKESLGKCGMGHIGKPFCRELVQFYEKS